MNTNPSSPGRGRISRRQFVRTASIAAPTSFLIVPPSSVRSYAANERLDIGIVGVANRGGANLNGVSGENIVALCDVDRHHLDAAAKRFSSARHYADYRRMLEREKLDAVVVSTPDHTHAVAACAALKNGQHVYCEKPLTRTLSECRAVSDAARKNKRATQMGTQIHAGDNYRRVVELIRAGAIGTIGEVHVWVGSSYGGRDRPQKRHQIPGHLNYDLWLGPTRFHRSYQPGYHPFHWRHWWDFAGGALADMGCHHIDLSHWALGLRRPETVEIMDGPALHPDSTPQFLVVQYHYAAQGKQPPVKLTWYHGGKRPPHFADGLLPQWGDGNLFVGSKGMLLAGYGKHVLLPEEKFRDYQPPRPSIPRSIGHHAEWIRACKTGSPTTCNFDYAGALTETVLLGNVAFRTGKKLEWDSAKLRASNAPEAGEFIQHVYRAGWRL